LLVGLALGCGGDDAPKPAHEHEHASPEPSTEDDVIPCPSSTPTFEPGMSVEGEGARITARLVSAQPTAPRKFENSWVLEFVDAEGQPIDDIQVTPQEPWMDVHNHGGGYAPDVVAQDEPGQLKIERINLKMPGPWRLNLNASSATVGEDEIVIHVCVP
jgi:hypothetical protein